MTEIIWDKEKDFDFTETISNEIIETPTYDYWQSQTPLDYNVALRNKPVLWAKCYTNSFTRLASEWTGIWTITWIVDSEWKPFIPKIVQIYAWRNTSSTNISFWTWMNNPSTSQCIITTSVWTTFNFSNIIWVWIDANLLNSWSWEVRLNISTVYHDTYLVITCFW